MANDTVFQAIKKSVASSEVKKRMNDILGNKSEQFLASIVNTVASNSSLQKCTYMSIMSAAFVAAALDLTIDPNLGFSAVVPYGDKAQFQIMYKGFIQLAIRTGQYRGMNVSEIYDDELEYYNPIYKEIVFTHLSGAVHRKTGDANYIAGYYAWFELINGFRQRLYMTSEEVEIHAKTYSKAYKYDISGNKKTSLWSIDFKAMALKTVIKLLLSKWGILSVEMQKAVIEDQKIHDGIASAGKYIDNPQSETEEEQVINSINYNPFEKKLSESQKELKYIDELVNIYQIAADKKIPDNIIESIKIKEFDKVDDETCLMLIKEANSKVDGENTP